MLKTLLVGDVHSDTMTRDPIKIKYLKADVRQATKLSNFVAQICLGNCQFSIGKQSPNKHGF